MERDFMGLSSKDSEIVVKEDFVVGSCKDSGFAKICTLPIPNFMSLKSEQDEKPSLMMSSFLEANQKRQPLDLQNFAMRQQFLGGNAHTMLLPTASVTGTTEQLINSKVSDQLTIFYAGTVNVFDGISPEKAQAIMLLAGNYRVPSNTIQSKLHAQAPKHQPPCGNQEVAMNMPPCSGLPSPMSVSSHPVSSIGSAALTAMISSVVPQSRKASLARFLKKRNERVLTAAPYNLVKKESTGFGFSDTHSSFTPDGQGGH